MIITPNRFMAELFEACFKDPGCENKAMLFVCEKDGDFFGEELEFYGFTSEARVTVLRLVRRSPNGPHEARTLKSEPPTKAIEASAKTSETEPAVDLSLEAYRKFLEAINERFK